MNSGHALGVDGVGFESNRLPNLILKWAISGVEVIFEYMHIRQLTRSQL
jgi:hypothetical protein